MNLTLWCSSSLPATVVAPATLRDPLGRVDSVLRPVLAVAGDTTRNGVNPAIGGYGVAFKSATSAATIPTAALR
jgi:hypothetical protein